jgi:hypothetical protein
MAFPPTSPLTTAGFQKFLSFSYHRMIEWAVMAFVDLKLADRLIHAAPDNGFTVEEIIDDDRSTWNKEMLYRILQACIDADIVKRVNDDQHFVLTESGAMLTTDHPSHAHDLIAFYFGSQCNRAADKLIPAVDFGRFESLVDHGGSRGTFLAEILHHYPSIKQGIIFDLPIVINEVKQGEDFQLHHISKDR